MLKLPQVTVCIVDCLNQGKAVLAIKKTLEQIEPNKVLFFTDVDIQVEGVETVLITKIESKNQYSHFVIKSLSKYIETDFVLFIQHDGYPINSKAWEDDFLNYDYLGASWLYPSTERCVGNGGCSIRSKKLLDILAADDFIEITEQEDDAICRLYGAYLESKYKMKFAPIDVADKFSFELKEPCDFTFAFHGYHYQPFQERVLIIREASMGDIIMAEPLIEYYSLKGYSVVLDIPIEEMNLFSNYMFSLEHISTINPKIKYSKVVNLNMAYEISPKKLVLQSYYEMAGINDGKYRNSILYIHQNENERLFNKYILIHWDNTNMPYRNSYGVNWKLVVAYFTKLGYLVLQVGRNPIENIAPHFNCPTKHMLMYLCKGADLVIGLDSGVCQISVALGTPCVILSGSVNLALRYVNFDNIGIVQGKCEKEELKHCYHNSVGVSGTECVINKELPPCSIHSEFSIIKESNKLLKLN